MQRKYDPNLLWGYINDYATEHYPDRSVNDKITVFFYVRGKPGAFYMHNPKLYWDETVGDGYFGNTAHDALEKNAADLREVIIYGLKKNREPVMFRSFNDFLGSVGLVE